MVTTNSGSARLTARGQLKTRHREHRQRQRQSHGAPGAAGRAAARQRDAGEQRHRAPRSAAASAAPAGRRAASAAPAAARSAPPRRPRRPKRASTPASSAEAIAIGMRFITRSNQPVAPTSVISAAQTMKAPTASAMAKRHAAPPASTAAPGVDQATITGLRQHSDSTGRQAHAEAERPHPRADLRRRGAERLRGLEHDGHRTGEADQHGDEAGGERRQRQVTSQRARGDAAPGALRRAHTASSAGRRGLFRSRPWRPARRPVGRQVQEVGRAAGVVVHLANSFSRQGAMPPPMVGITMSRERK